jgi:DEAD/DEAH box helicase domain-containing protein
MQKQIQGTAEYRQLDRRTVELFGGHRHRAGVYILSGSTGEPVRISGDKLARPRKPTGGFMEHWDGQMDLFDANPRREVSQDQKVVVFDLETQRSFADVGGRSQLHKLGVSVGVAYSYDRDEFLVVTEDEIDQLIELLLEAELVVGYNIRGFDYEVLRGYTDRDLQSLPTFDIMYDLEERLGFRPKLESVASPTLGVGKSADGLQALEWWRRGEVDKIAEYCREDVRVTRDLYDFGKRNRWVQVDRFGGKPRKVEVEW